MVNNVAGVPTVGFAGGRARVLPLESGFGRSVALDSAVAIALYGGMKSMPSATWLRRQLVR